MIENMKAGSLKFWKSLSFPYKTSIFGKLILQLSVKSASPLVFYMIVLVHHYLEITFILKS